MLKELIASGIGLKTLLHGKYNTYESRPVEIKDENDNVVEYGYENTLLSVHYYTMRAIDILLLTAVAISDHSPNYNVVKFLLKHGANPNKFLDTNHPEETALLYAIDGNNFALVVLLLAYGADVTNGYLGEKTAVDWAKKLEARPSIIALLETELEKKEKELMTMLDRSSASNL